MLDYVGWSQQIALRHVINVKCEGEIAEII
jgi:hypothetical protein